jgi:hypothetical protein
LKGGEDVVAAVDASEPFDWDQAAGKVREHLNDAMNARNVAFLLGSGCSSHIAADGKQVGIPTMKPMAERFVGTIGTKEKGAEEFATQEERQALENLLGLNIAAIGYSQNLEQLMEVLYSFQFALSQSANTDLQKANVTVAAVIKKIIGHILKTCSDGAFSNGDDTVASSYQSFYRKLIYRDRALPRPWVFTTNYDQFNEVAMDRLGIPYCNGFSGTVERRFNPATFRYSLAEQLDITSRKWSAVDNFVYLCKLHGSINWVEENTGLFPVRELQNAPIDNVQRVIIYPTPAKQNASFGSPYSDLFRELQTRIVRDQSVLFVIGYSFCDEHINNILFQALTVPTFRMIAFVPPNTGGVVANLVKLNDPRIWIIGGDGPKPGRFAHYFDTFIEHFMPESPGDKVDNAVAEVLHTMMGRGKDKAQTDDDDDV